MPTRQVIPEQPTVESTRTPRTWLRRLRDGILHLPLMVKLTGANLLVALAVTVAAAQWEGRDLFLLGGLTLASSLLLSSLLIRIALGPLDRLSLTAHRLQLGEEAPTIDASDVEDARFVELRESFNRLLLQVERDRARIRQLALISLELRETERAALADTLREAIAQDLAALTMRLGAATTACGDPSVAPHLDAALAIARSINAEVAVMADSAFPGLLGQLGLVPVLEAMGRRVAERSGIQVSVDSIGLDRPISLPVAKVFFRVAEEAVRNTEVHAQARSLRLSLISEGDRLQLRIEDDGAGFDPGVIEQQSAGIGLFRARELLGQIGGELQVTTAPGQGAIVIATVRQPERSHGGA